MDRTGIIVVTICALLLGAWFIQEQKYQVQRPPPQAVTNAVAAAPTPAATPTTASSTPVATPWFNLGSNAPESLITITNGNAHYTFTSLGGGLKSVELSKYPDSISLRWKKQMTTNDFATFDMVKP